MARDLHDVIASHLSAIAITSGAALAAPPDAGRDRDALTRVREASLASLAEMRSMIRVLRADEPGDDGVGLAATPRLAALDDLVAWARDAGLDVTVHEDGVLGSARAGELPAAVDQAAYRIAREALTNALKHGGTGGAGARGAAGAPGAPDGASSTLPDGLTRREVDVLAALGRGLSNQAIAQELVITEATAKTHVSRVLAKLGVTSRVQAAIVAREAGVV
ncbi:hybrid sensor histidine kinase/response regulator transcription factor [Isoptericola variabilis]|uniref:histidine kinase n=1 Tax=Isoptericola variabilis (strain 225) TaxID=743718 RepID=F6FQJ3_ISOV2|nr:LuxR C-terminal-related transcriptional regulator [Isoptericola variabilis]AEG44889.1 transcriptional regulator, LuxR family [Isoptericola variabilis 225]TWH28359.1 Response regulator containing a CheY-like receiver domain and an HTH DNA-binding domain [Isoptericola variabilis J7]